MSAKHYTIEESITGLQMPMALRELLEKVWLLPKKYVHFLRMSGSRKARSYIFHVVNLQRNRTWFPENFHK